MSDTTPTAVAEPTMFDAWMASYAPAARVVYLPASAADSERIDELRATIENAAQPRQANASEDALGDQSAPDLTAARDELAALEAKVKTTGLAVHLRAISEDEQAQVIRATGGTADGDSTVAFNLAFVQSACTNLTAQQVETLRSKISRGQWGVIVTIAQGLAMRQAVEVDEDFSQGS